MAATAASHFIEDHLSGPNLSENLLKLKSVLTLMNRYLPETAYANPMLYHPPEALIRTLKAELSNNDPLAKFCENELLKFANSHERRI